jgi:WD40 repeat protein
LQEIQLIFTAAALPWYVCVLPCSPEVVDPATVCVASLTLPGVTSLSLSADQLLLACVTGNAVQVYSLPHLLHHQSDAPVCSLDLGMDLVQFAWSPDASGRDSACSYLALTSGRVLLHGSLMSGSAALADGVECAAWSPDGQHIAYSSGSRLVVTAPDWKDSAFTVNIPPPEGEGEDCTASAAAAFTLNLVYMLFSASTMSAVMSAASDNQVCAAVLPQQMVMAGLCQTRALSLQLDTASGYSLIR